MTPSINIPVYSDALVVLGTAGFIVPLVKRWGVNPVLVYLAAGVLLGPLGLGSLIKDIPILYWFTVTDAKNVSGIADLGIVFLLFLIGLELSFDRLIAMRKLVIGLGGVQITLSTLLIGAVAYFMGNQLPSAIVIGTSLALSSTAIVLDVITSAGKLETPSGRASFAVLFCQDLAVIPILMFISIIGANAEASLFSTLGRAFIEAAIAIGVITLVGRVILKPLFQLVANAQSTELFIAATLFVVVGTGVVAASAGMSMALGAFIAGLLLAETEYRKAVISTIGPFKGILLGIFFFTVGMSLDVRTIANHGALIAASVAGLIIIKSLIITLAARGFGIPWAAAWETGLLLGPGGEFAFVAITLALSLGVIDPQSAHVLFAITTLSMACIPFLATLFQNISRRLNQPEPLAPDLKVLPQPGPMHVLVIGYGRVGKVVCALLDTCRIAYTATDHNADSVAEERRNGQKVFYGDATKADYLNACGIMSAAGIVITVRSRSIVKEIVIQARKLRPDIIIFARARDAAHAKQLYALGVNNAVPETVEASLLLSEAALLGLGIPENDVTQSIQQKREKIRKDLQAACKQADEKSFSG